MSAVVKWYFLANVMDTEAFISQVFIDYLSSQLVDTSLFLHWCQESQMTASKKLTHDNEENIHTVQQQKTMMINLLSSE